MAFTPEDHEFRIPQSMTPEELGDNLARLVWESFSDFLANGDTEVPLAHLGVPEDDGFPDPHSTEEALIFLMWAHTRGAQLAFLRRESEELVREGLDALHRAVFEDMVQHGTPAAHLPVFEQRVSARYSEYHQAAEVSDQALGTAVMRHLTRSTARQEHLARAVSERALAVAGPLRDFLSDVDLEEA
jgi:hypothetical protein